MKKQFRALALLMSVGFPALVSAQGFQVNLQGQKQQGMGSAGTALPQDAAAVFFNPGSVSFLEKNSITAGANGTISNTIFQDANTFAQYRTNSPVSTPFAAYAVYGMAESKLKFGLGVYTPFGSTVKWEDNWTGRFAITQLQLQTIFIQPTVSYKITDKIGFGAGFIYAPGKVNLQRDLPIFDGTNYAHAELDGKATGYGFNAGLYFAATEKLSFGLTYRSKVNMKVTDGTATFTVPTALDPNFPDGNFTASLALPQIITLGIGFKASDNLQLAFDFNFGDWSGYDTLAFDYETNTSSLEDTKSPRMYENSYAFRLGAQYKLMSELDLRAGVGYSISPIQDGYVTPESPDANRLNLTAGLGYRIGEHFAVDASYTFAQLKRTDKNLETNLDGTFKTYVSIPGLSLSYHF
ncbi:MAG: OmpP1/FadL family transporter [Bacteroidota bacterium]|jgi:long-chain fatty acid transport protein